jgi:hypothetical protein
LALILQLQLFSQEKFTYKKFDCVISDSIDGLKIYVFVDSYPLIGENGSKFQEYVFGNLHFPQDHSVYYGSISFTFVVDTLGIVSNPCILTYNLRDDLLHIPSEFIDALNNIYQLEPAILDNKKVPVRISSRIILGR